MNNLRNILRVFNYARDQKMNSYPIFLQEAIEDRIKELELLKLELIRLEVIEEVDNEK
jgi:hypothetical protein